MPVHNGHLALIDFAKSQCNELIVSMSYTLTDPIDHNIRFGWLKQLLADDPNVKVEESLDDFDDESVHCLSAPRFGHGSFKSASQKLIW